MIHGGSAVDKISRVPGPTGPSRKLGTDEISWKKLGPLEVIPMGYSSAYPDGRRTILIGTHQHVVKLDADTLRTLSTYVVRPGNYLGEGEIAEAVDKFDHLAASGDNQRLYDAVSDYVVPRFRDEQVCNGYSFINRHNEKVMFVKDRTSGKRYLNFYGDSVDGVADSPIVLKRQWEIPAIQGKPFIPLAMNMTFDGWIILVSNAGTMIALSGDLAQIRTLDLAAGLDASLDFMQSFVRNNVAVDDKNGIYVVTKNFLARVQWTGDQLSMDTALGAWKADYPSGARGSGVTPALMGWGDNEDHLVVLADGSDEDPHIMLFWRDAIPEDWQGIAGYDRRVAGVASVMFAKGKRSRARIENSPPVMGYGIFATPESPTTSVPEQSSVLKQFVAETIAASRPGSEASGGTKWEWNPHARKLELAWMTPLKLASTICTPSVNGILYCVGRRSDNFTLEGIDWNNGHSLFHYTLGPSYKYFSYTTLVVAPNGAVDIQGWLGMGLVRVQPKQLKEKR